MAAASRSWPIPVASVGGFGGRSKAANVPVCGGCTLSESDSALAVDKRKRNIVIATKNRIWSIFDFVFGTSQIRNGQKTKNGRLCPIPRGDRPRDAQRGAQRTENGAYPWFAGVLSPKIG